jgi:peptide subunit release factor RF-3
VQEAISLKQEIREGKIKLKEHRSFTKDRIVTLAYGNMFFNVLENRLSKEDQVEDFDEDAWKNIILV